MICTLKILSVLSVRVKWEEVLSLCKNKILLASAVQVLASAVQVLASAVQVLASAVQVLASAVHILKLERYRED